MAVTTEDLVTLKDQAVAACAAIVTALDTANSVAIYAASEQCVAAVKASSLYDAADQDEHATSVADHKAATQVALDALEVVEHATPDPNEQEPQR